MLLAPLVAAGLFLAGCDDSSGPDNGRLTIQLTDAPGDLAEAFIKVDHFVLFETGSDDEGEGEGEGEGRIELMPEHGGYIDLLTLQGGQVLDLVDDALVPAGSYSELRMVLDEAYVRLEDGRVYATENAELPAGVTAAGTLRCPSCSQSGFKVKFLGDGLRVEDNSVVLIDFDVAQSFGHQAGQSGQWIMRPVLRATTNTIMLGTIDGTVALDDGVTLPATCGGTTGAITQFRPFAVMGEDTITGVVDEAGAYSITGLMPGTYTLGHWAELSFTDGATLTFAAAATPASVTVPEGDVVESNFVVTSATCQAGS